MSTVGMTPDERKLQPAYEDVSAGRYKSAESTVTRHLKKNPKSLAALTLRFVLLERQHAPVATCLKALKDIRACGDLNPRSLWWTTTSLRNLKRLDICVELYQDMWTKYPTSMEIGEQVFLNAAACWDTKTMAESSRKVFNGVKNAERARMAAWAEWANRSPQPTSSAPFPPPAPEGTLKIASILLATAGPSVPSSDILWLRLQVLLSSGQDRKAHELLMEHGQGGGLARDWYRMKGVEEIAKREREQEKDVTWVWEQELGEFLQKWRKDGMARRNYAYYQHSITAAKALLASKPDLVRGLIDVLIELDGTIGDKERAPKLARLELDLALVQHSSDLAMSETDWKEVVMDYLNKWGSKGSIIPELEAIIGERKEWLATELKSRIASGQNDEKSFRAVVNYHVYHLRQKETTWQPSEEDVKLYWQLYLDGLAYGKNLPRTDIQPADEIGLTAVQLVLSTNSPAAPLRAILCLEYMISQSPSCTHAKYLLIRLYRLTGALSLVAPLLDDLKATESQLDTLLHIWVEGGATDALLAPLPKGQEQPAWDKWTSAMEKMYSRTETDLPEYVKQAIENESYSKIHSIRSLAQTLAFSQTRANMMVEQARIRLVKSSNRDEWPCEGFAEVAGWKEEEVQDSRNWELMPSIGGNRSSAAGLTRLRKEEGSGDVARRAGSIDALISGTAAPKAIAEGSSDSDSLFYGALNRIASKMSGAASGEGSDSISTIFDDFVNLPSGSRWSTLNHLVHIVELAPILDTLSKALSGGKPTSKAKPKDPKSNTLAKGLQDVKVSLKEKVKPLVGHLNGLMMDDREIDWRGINSGLVDEDFVAEVGRKVVVARVAALERLKGLLAAI